VIDLAAILPFYLEASGFLALRSLRLLRLLRLFKLGRYSRALNLFVGVVRGRSSQLGIFMLVSCVFIFVAATGIFYAEHTVQPEVFSSIPACLWWAVVTLTTIGYGDAYPITVAGKVFTSLVALFGVGVIAIPTGVVSAGLVEAMRKPSPALGSCPHCGKSLER
jgi:voltage-gated potassium channel